MRPTSSEYVGHVLELHASGEWIWLVEVEVGTDRVIYLTPRNHQVTWAGKTWHPYPMTIPEIPQESGANAITFALTVLNIDDTITELLSDEELQGQAVRLYIVRQERLGDDEPLGFVEATILAASAKTATAEVTFTLGARNWLQTTLGRRFTRGRCIHVYGGDACGYNLDRPGALATCTQLLDGTNGCTEHGDDEEAAGLKRHHPDRILAFRGLPRANRG